MGTNYYARYDNCDCNCPNCGLKDIEYHIGKSSAGWAFSLHVDPTDGVHDLEDILTLIVKTNATIYNEYEEMVSMETLLDIILNRPDDVEHHGDDERHMECLGSYDLVTGDFS